MKTFKEMYESKLFKESLKESTYVWNIDENDRSWYITTDGKLLSDVSHRIILKRQFKSEWTSLKKKELDDNEIDKILEDKLIIGGYIKIGELDNFYSIVGQLDDRTKNELQDFTKSLLKVRPDVKNKVFTIDSNNKPIRCLVKEISEDFLFTID